ncbi:MAG: CinA family protein [Lentisphaerae bacterium]|nr:CinA family protein [Lentisphaerota bacterium]
MKPPEERIGALLARGGATLAVAESCTGGMVAARITSVPGSSAYFHGGYVAYSNRMKREDLGLPAEVLAAEGAVSDAAARGLAEGARRRRGADWGVGVTGIAGPAGGTPEKPVGLVFVAVAGPDVCCARRCVFRGGREAVRAQAAEAALALLADALEQHAGLDIDRPRAMA